MNVLIVDDDIAMRQIIERTVRTVGCDRIDAVATGQDALGLVVRWRGEYGLITLDLRLPSIGGLDILSAVRAVQPHAVIALATAYPEDISPQVYDHADAVLTKPFNLGKMRALVRLAQEIKQKRMEIRSMSDPF